MGWGVVGVLIGIGGGYFAYVKKKPRFRSTATVQVNWPSQDDSSNSEQLGTTDQTDSTQADDNQKQSAIAGGNQIGGEHQSGSKGTSDRLLVLTDAVVNEAVHSGALRGLPEMARIKTESKASESGLAGEMIQSGLVEISRPEPGSFGSVYTVTCLGDTPTSSQKIANAIASGFQASVTSNTNQSDWQKSLGIMQELLEFPTQRLLQLREQRDRLVLPDDATLRDDEVVSRAAEQLRLLRPRVDSLLIEQSDLRAKLRNVESLIGQGASAEMLLTALGQSIDRMSQSPGSKDRGNRADSDQTSQSDAAEDLVKAKREYQARLAEREKVLRDVERSLVPLQAQKDTLLKQYGSKHPRVKAVDFSIEQIRLKVAALPDLGPEPGTTPFPKTPSSSPGESTSRATGESPSKDSIESSSNGNDLSPPASHEKDVSVLLKALRIQQRQVDQELRSVRLATEQAATDVAKQKQVLQEAQRIGGEIEREQALRDQITARLKIVPVAPPTTHARVEVLQSATPGVQFEPTFKPYLIIGGSLGFIAAFIFGGLLLATSAATASEPVSPSP